MKRLQWYRCLTVVVMSALVLLAAMPATEAAPSDPLDFNYTTTATGTHTYPFLAVGWIFVQRIDLYQQTAPTREDSLVVTAGGVGITVTDYLYPPEGYIAQSWRSKNIVANKCGGRVVDAYIDTVNNRLVMTLYSGDCGGKPEKYSEEFFLTSTEGEDTFIETLISRQISDMVKIKPYGYETRSIDPWWVLIKKPPEGYYHKGVTSLAINDARVSGTWYPESSALTTGGQISFTNLTNDTDVVPWSDTESGSGQVTGLDGDKLIAVSALVAPDNNTVWTVVDDSDDVDTWMVGPELYAKVSNQPPVCESATAAPAILWPANHKFVTIVLSGVIDPDGEAITVTIDGVIQDEPVDKAGDGQHNPDAVINGASVDLRAERLGGGNGRVYHLYFTGDDGRGGSCSGQVIVGVPHDKKDPPVDDGAVYDSTQP